MSKLSYPTKEIKIAGRTFNVPFVRKRRRFRKVNEEYVTTEDIGQSPCNLYSTLAGRHYGDPNLWYLIDDVNPLVHDCDAAELDFVRIAPIKDFQNLSLS